MVWLACPQPIHADERKLIRDLDLRAISAEPRPGAIDALLSRPGEAQTAQFVPLLRRSPGFDAAAQVLGAKAVGVIADSPSLPRAELADARALAERHGLALEVVETDEPADPRWNGSDFEGHGGSRVFYPGLGRWNNADFQDEWKDVDECGRIVLRGEPDRDRR